MRFHISQLFAIAILLIFLANLSFAKRVNLANRRRRSSNLNVIDRCWRRDRNWGRDRQKLAQCSVGFAGKMTNNIGLRVTHYIVTDQSDHPLNPKVGTLRYGVTKMRGTVWITFQRDMLIRLQKPILVGSYTTIDGRGVNVEIAHGSCFLLNGVSNVIIHNLRFHHCHSQAPGPVMGPGAKIVQLQQVDGDAIRLVRSSKVWIDHNTLYECQDGLIDITRGSTDVTISNNWFRNHDKVMLLGHHDSFIQDKNMRVTVAFNYFGPNCNQRMPRIRHGYAHVVNNVYQGWAQYAIGGSMNPSIRSESNLFIAQKIGNKKVTWRDGLGDTRSWNWQSVKDVFENGAFFRQSGNGGSMPRYNREQWFPIEDARALRSLTRSAGTRKRSRY